jgi:hypothetical protein
MDDNFEVYAERILILNDAVLAQKREIKIQIGKPYWTEPDVEAACPVAIRGLIGRVNDIRGIDFVDAMKQTIGFIETYLQGVDVTGKTLYWPDGERYLDEPDSN